MARSEWLRTFVAVYRSGSVTDGADHRGITQPAASQHLGALERSLGEPLFVRMPSGMEPTQRGRALYVQVADLRAALDKSVSLGAAIVAEPFDVPGGPTLAGITDPEGNPVMLVQA